MFGEDAQVVRERAEIDRGLAQLDVSSRHGPWTLRLLRLVRERPGVSAAELAALQGRPVSRFKADVWKLRELRLVDTLPVGYQLSDRAAHYLAHRD